jgi:hypothetical protein
VLSALPVQVVLSAFLVNAVSCKRIFLIHLVYLTM